jgi:hypothetical protein
MLGLMIANNQLDSVTKMLADLIKTFFHKSKIKFLQEISAPINPRAKNSKFLEFDFKRFRRCDGGVRTIL